MKITCKPRRRVVDSQLSRSAHVAAVCRSGYYQLRQLRQAVRSLFEDASKTLVHSTSGVRFLSPGLLQLSVLRSASRKFSWTGCSRFRTPPPAWLVVTGYWYSTFRPHNASTPSATLVHWLPVHQRVGFKVAMLVHRSLSGMSPSYLADDCRLVAVLTSDDYVPQRAEHAL